MNNMVSIITPVYNAEKYLRYAIESVLSQDYCNWEMLIVDDCSNDNSRLIVEEFAFEDKRIKLIALKKNSGVAFARNKGIEAATGRYIAFLDSDDLWYPDKLSKQICFMEKNDYHFTFSSYEWIDESGKKLNKTIKAPYVVNYEKLLRGNPIGCLTVIIDRKRTEKIKMPDIKHEDYATWLNITKSGINAYGINESLALYRRSKNSLSSNKVKAIRWTWNIYKHHEKLGFTKSLSCLLFYIISAITKYLGFRNL